MKRPNESDYTSHVAYARALEEYCDMLEQPAQEPVARIAVLEAALNEIASAGMSPSPEMSDDGKTAWHASQAWRFIGIAARAIELAPAPVGEQCCYHDSDCAVHNMPAYPAGPCDCSLASLAQPAREPVIGTKTWFEDGKIVTQNLYHSDIYTTPPAAVMGIPTTGDYAMGYAEGFNDACKRPAQEPHNFCLRCGKRLQGVLGQPQVHTCTPPLWGHI
jgi:hypothetical protein